MKKIMFNDRYGLTQAVLEGRKTQTRRIINTNLYNRVDWKAFEEGNYDCIITDDASAATDIRDLAAYRVGEEVSVAQSYKDARCDYYFHRGLPGWNNKMFVRADEMPHRIRITNIRVERLQDISDEDCLKEGIEKYNCKYTVLNDKNKVSFFCDEARLAFKWLINHTCGKNTWIENPYVFVYDFELVK